MTSYFDTLGTIVQLELRQRIRSVAWLVLVIVVFALVGIVTALLWFSITAFGGDISDSAGVYSTIIFFVLLVGTLVTPAISGAAINGDRDAGTLATTQVTLASANQIVLGKFLAAWTVALTFLVASLPALLFTLIAGGVPGDTLAASLGVLVLELGVVAAVGVGLSGLITRPLFSVVTTYLVVAALSIGTLIAFTLGGLAFQSQQTQTYIGIDYSVGGEFDPVTGYPENIVCLDPEVTTYTTPRFDYVWGILAANPYIVLADAAPTSFDSNGFPQDLFGSIALGVRSAQLSPDLTSVIDECAAALAGDTSGAYPYETPREIFDRTVPSWFVGLLIHLVLAAAALAGAIARTRTPAGALPTGSRVA
ncbi:ABC transporter permease [Microcella sp.]|uniref:ABC transporter permease n=1 Tax=Microcella sp. TaxID=1913979 RepID=UPI00299F5332|nr:ABC transporter permease [Microcella sp.]MDX2025426.1 ABC transporter permease [Microcella sp.]